MDAAEVMEALRARGLGLTVRDDGRLALVGKAPPPELVAAVRASKDALLALLRPAPPAGAVLYLADDGGRACGPGPWVRSWCWSGGPRWFYTNEHPVPGGYEVATQGAGKRDGKQALLRKGAKASDQPGDLFEPGLGRGALAGRDGEDETPAREDRPA